MQCNFIRHNTPIHILLFLFKPNIKRFIEDQNLYPDLCTPLYVEKGLQNANKVSIYGVLNSGSNVPPSSVLVSDLTKENV